MLANGVIEWGKRLIEAGNYNDTSPVKTLLDVLEQGVETDLVSSKKFEHWQYRLSFSFHVFDVLSVMKESLQNLKLFKNKNPFFGS